MSIFLIVIIASNARLAVPGSGSVIAWVRTTGVICQDKPHLSLHQPHALSSPPLPTIAMEQETWEGDTLHFRMRALGQTAAASIEVLEDALRIEVSLPWLLAKAAKHLLPILRKEATLLLEKK